MPHPPPFEKKLHLTGEELGGLVCSFTRKRLSITFTATGISMKPVIFPGQKIMVRPYDTKKPAIGDVAAYLDQDNGKLICHRIIRVEHRSFVSRGDNCGLPDQAHPLSAILGYVDVPMESFPIRCLFRFPIKTVLAFLCNSGILYRINGIFNKI